MLEIASEVLASTPSFLQVVLEARPSETCLGNGILGGEAVWAYIRETASQYPGLPVLILVASHDLLQEELGLCRVEVRIYQAADYPVSSDGATSVPHYTDPNPALRTDPTLAYIQAHCAEKITLNEAAKASGMNPRELSTAFRRERGKPFKSFLLTHRLDLSRAFLRQGRSVKWAAASAGFRDQSYFSRAFKARFKMTPTEFKERCSLGA